MPRITNTPAVPIIKAIDTQPSYIPIQFKLLAINDDDNLATEILGLLNDIFFVNGNSTDTFQNFCKTFQNDDEISIKTLKLTSRLNGISHKYIKAYLECIKSVVPGTEPGNTGTVTYDLKGTTLPSIKDKIPSTVMDEFLQENITSWEKNNQYSHYINYIIALQHYYGVKSSLKKNDSLRP